MEMVSKDKTNWFSIGDFKFREGKKEYIFPVFDLQRGGEGNIYEWRIETAAAGTTFLQEWNAFVLHLVPKLCVKKLRL